MAYFYFETYPCCYHLPDFCADVQVKNCILWIFEGGESSLPYTISIRVSIGYFKP